MAAEPLFMDSGGFYALVSPDSETHELAVEIMQAAENTNSGQCHTCFVEPRRAK
jgi:hypothetical protein